MTHEQDTPHPEDQPRSEELAESFPPRPTPEDLISNTALEQLQDPQVQQGIEHVHAILEQQRPEHPGLHAAPYFEGITDNGDYIMLTQISEGGIESSSPYDTKFLASFTPADQLRQPDATPTMTDAYSQMSVKDGITTIFTYDEDLDKEDLFEIDPNRTSRYYPKYRKDPYQQPATVYKMPPNDDPQHLAELSQARADAARDRIEELTHSKSAKPKRGGWFHK
jgi:hypothetical protein